MRGRAVPARTAPDVTNISYDDVGRRTSMTDGTGTSIWVWDSLGRLTSSVDGASKIVGYGYDRRGNVTSIAYPGSTGTVTRTFDNAGRLWKVKDWLNHETVFNYDADSFLTGQVYPNGTTATSTPDAAGQLSGISHAPTVTPDSPFASFAHGRDNLGQLTSVTSTDVPTDNHSYEYTAINQLSRDNGAAYAYDTADNLVARAGGKTQAYDAAHQLCWSATTPGPSCASPPTGATTYGHDTRGNRTTMTTSGIATTLAYDQANRLKTYGTGNTYTYNGDGLRTSKTVSGTTSAFTWDLAAGLPLLLVDGTTNYVHGPGGLPLEQVTSAGVVTYYHHDQLGSTRALTNSAGAVVATYTYDPYGKVTASTGTATNPFGFAGQYTDAESGLQYLRARYYDPGTGVFITRDPIEAQTREPYGYVGGNPLNATDPAGLNKCEVGLNPLRWAGNAQDCIADHTSAPDYITVDVPLIPPLGGLPIGIGGDLALTLTRDGHVYAGGGTAAGLASGTPAVRGGWLDKPRSTDCDINDFVSGWSASANGGNYLVGGKTYGFGGTSTEVGVGLGPSADAALTYSWNVTRLPSFLRW